MSVEDILDMVGSNGPYQFRLYGLIFFTTFMCGLNYYTQIFIFAAPSHDCNEPILASNGNILSKDDGVEQITYKFNYDSLFPTIASENNWVCENDHRQAIVHQLFWGGNIVGYLFWGYTNDNFGRRPTVVLSHAIYFLGGLMTMFSPYFWLICCSRFFVGFAHLAISHLPYLIAIEYCGIKTRTYPLLIVMISNTLASVAVPALAMILPSWRYLTCIAIIPIPLVIIGSFFGLVPESLSWLICEGKTEKVQKAAEIVARINGQSLEGKERFLFNLILSSKPVKPDDIRRNSVYPAMGAAKLDIPSITITSPEQEKSDYSPSDDETSPAYAPNGFVAFKNLVSRCKTRFRIRVLLGLWITFIGFTSYYGHASNTSNLGESMHLSFIFAALVELPAATIPVVINVLGRRWSLFFLFLFAGAACITYAIVPPDFSIIVALVGRFFATGAYYVCLQYASELFPTSIRGAGLSACEVFGGVGLLLSPWIVYLSKFGISIPLLIFGGMSIVGAVLTFFLPETCDQVLPNTVEDANIFGEDQGYFDCIMCAAKPPDSKLTMKKRLSTITRTLHYEGQFTQEVVEDVPIPVRRRWSSIYEM